MVYRSGALRLWNAAPSEMLAVIAAKPGKQLPKPPGEIGAFSADLRRVALPSHAGVILRDSASGEIVHTLVLRSKNHYAQQIRFSADGKRLAVVSKLQLLFTDPQKRLAYPLVISVFDCETGGFLGGHSLFASLKQSSTVGLDPEGALLAVGTGNVLSTYAVSERQSLQSLTQDSVILATAFHPRRLWCATGGEDGVVRVWDLSTGKLRATFKGHEGEVTFVEFSPPGDKLISVARDRGVCLWDSVSGDLLSRFDSNNDEGAAVAFSIDGRRLATANFDLTVSIRDATTGREFLTLSGAREPVARLAFSEDGQRLAAAFKTGKLITWDCRPPSPEAVAQQQIALRHNWHTKQAEEWLRREQWLSAAWHLDRLLADQPDDAKLRSQRTRCLLQAGAWERIDRDDAQPLVLDPLRDEDRALGYQAAYLFVSRGHTDAYQRLCRSFQDASDKESNTFRQSVMLRLCIVGPGVGEPQRLIDQTRAALASYRDPFVFHYTLGGALYRAGQFESAAKELEAAAKVSTNAESQVLNWLLLALAQHRLGAGDEAAKWLANADEWIAKFSQGHSLETVPVPGVSLRSALVFPLLREEARKLMGK